MTALIFLTAAELFPVYVPLAVGCYLGYAHTGKLPLIFPVKLEGDSGEFLDVLKRYHELYGAALTHAVVVPEIILVRRPCAVERVSIVLYEVHRAFGFLFLKV